MMEVTQLLLQIESGNRQAAATLLPLVYEELRRLAAGHMANESPGQTLNATALVHEAYLKLVTPTGDRDFANRGHFFAAAAQAMRWILVDAARRKRALKRDGGHLIEIADLNPAQRSTDDVDQWIDIDEAITAFEAVDASAAAFAKLRIFGGLSVEEAADSVGISRAGGFRTWTYARAWLTAALADHSKFS